MKQGFTIAKVIENEWFKKGYKPPSFEQTDVSLDDWDAIFDESGASIFLLYQFHISIFFLHSLVNLYVNGLLGCDIVLDLPFGVQDSQNLVVERREE